jgi:hypothetical protein
MWVRNLLMQRLAYELLFKSLPNIRRLILFENFNEAYTCSIDRIPLLRTPSSDVSRAISVASLNLESLSASFILDATHFFSAFNGQHVQPRWPNLTSLSITSTLLTPDVTTAELSDLLGASAYTANKMPRLRVMEIWNGRRGMAALFRYQRDVGITWRATWDICLESKVIKAWNAVGRMHCSSCEFAVAKETMGCGEDIQSHGDAIIYLQLMSQIIRPISLQQIQIEHKMRRQPRLHQ